MNPRREPAGLLAQWLQFTQGEAKAIHSGAWSSVREIQAAKSKLREPIAELRDQWEGENSGESLPASGREDFRREVARLISLETRNGELLAARFQRARRERESLDQALLNLRNIRRSYSRNRKPATVWTTYS
jgi:hypothetical protein